MSVNIGDIGEKLLEMWCAESGLAINKANADKKGWDYIIQFSNEIVSENKLDKRMDEISLFVQVKTTTNKGKNRGIKISNWNNAIRNTLPSFILYIVLQKNNIVKEAYFIHIDEYYIEEVLKRLRQINDKNRLNHLKMYFKVDAKDILREQYGDSIKKRVLDVINGNLPSYTRRKAELLATLGYSKTIARGTITIEGKISEIVDFAVGFKETINVSKFTIESGIRFDIPDKVEEYENGLLEIDRIGKNVQLRFSNDDGIISTIDATMYNPHQVLPNIPIENTKIRINSIIGDLVFLFPNQISGKFYLSFESSDLSYTQQIQMAKIIIIFSNGKLGFSLDIIEKDTIIANHVFDKDKLSGFVFPKEIVDLANTLVELSTILARYDYYPKFNLSLNKILKYRDQIKVIYNILENKSNADYLFTFNHDTLIEDGFAVIIPMVMGFKIEDTFFVYSLLYRGVVTKNNIQNNRNYMCIAKPSIVKMKMVQNMDDQVLEKANEILVAEAAKDEKYTVLII